MCDTVSDDTVSDDTVSDDTVSDDTVSDDTVSDDTVSDDTGSDDTGSDDTGLNSDAGPTGDGTRARPLAERLADALAGAGSTVLFGLPGGGPNLDVVAAAGRRGLRFVLAHAETEAAIMAATYGLLTGAPAPVVVTRGPGAASVANGLAQATLDRFPLVVIADTVPRTSASRVAHQRVDQRALLGPAAKISATVSDGTTDAELSALVGSAARWPYGGVHLDYDPTAVDPAVIPAGALPVIPAVDPAVIQVGARELLARARRPVVILGVEAAAAGVGDRVGALGCPVLTTYQAVGAVASEGSANAGLFTNGALEAPVLAAADLIITVGLDLVEPIPAPWPYQAPVLRLSSVVQTDDYLPATVDLIGDLGAILDETFGHLVSGPSASPDPDRWDWGPDDAAVFRENARRRIRDIPAMGSDARFGPIELVDTVARHRPEGLTVTVDAGAHFLAVMPLWPVDGAFQLLISNGLATMGFALPAAIGAALARPGEPVLALTGDGGLSMVLAELETLARLELPVTVVVFNDSALSLIEIKQKVDHGGPGAVRYREVDYAAVAGGFGLDATIVRSATELADAVTDPGAWGGPRLIDARIDPAPYRHLIAVTRG